jgi:hypothetical protein
MTRRFLLPLAAALTMVVAPAMAAQMSGAQKCTALEKQFDQAIVKHGTAAKASDAKMLRTEGGKLCVAGKTAAGMKRIEQALNDIGVKPVY